MISYFFFEETIFVGLCAAAFLIGDREQRMVATALAFQFAMCALVVFGFGVKQRLSGAPPLTDAALLLTSLWLVVSGRKLWPVFFSGFQLAELVVDLRIFLGAASFNYQTVTYAVICGWLVLTSLLAGVLFENGPRSWGLVILNRCFSVGREALPTRKHSTD